MVTQQTHTPQKIITLLLRWWITGVAAAVAPQTGRATAPRHYAASPGERGHASCTVLRPPWSHPTRRRTDSLSESREQRAKQPKHPSAEDVLARRSLNLSSQKMNSFATIEGSGVETRKKGCTRTYAIMQGERETDRERERDPPMSQSVNTEGAAGGVVISVAILFPDTASVIVELSGFADATGAHGEPTPKLMSCAVGTAFANS